MSHDRLNRRAVLKGLGHLTLGAPGLSLAVSSAAAVGASGPAASADARLVLVNLRGGLDGLAAVAPMGDPAFAAARGPLTPTTDRVLALGTTDFALHGSLEHLHRLYGQGELLVLHAVGLPYRERSHFDAQQVLESGGIKPYEWTTGWLGRALDATHRDGLALTTTVPLVLRGASQVDTWAPSALPEPAADFVTRLQRLYEQQGDRDLAQALVRSRELRLMPGMVAEAQAGSQREVLLQLARKAADLLRRPDGARVAVLEMGGFDTHANQAAPAGPLANNLKSLDLALGALREQLAEVWAQTVVVVVTEFGREVAVNGTLGTDHGSGGAAFILGGKVRGGAVLADWPGLALAQRFEGRDLRSTLDLRQVFWQVLHDHWRVDSATLDRLVLPGAKPTRKLDWLRG